ncbi:DNA-binding transcriptional response regulator, NtrC family, contains REC, AAA-type ATPase, and a Fis-type DNA-binding domains [Franzmannia pantelleriensis]|uniref:DNA-binding transcriptional response regulator, NtrC family, contains REC, AAA-type ATPase, and a Fis-type DNA-binding domains n=1 Tax=Franzmannia pantelleriensis TaxID=48727 RepID=A0A1G9L743_9GAMM|nr:sigma-54 dependent transcriptional regulator [Halomonas pantelleriensis]SDL57761.1 DNA-binding transcriptional response regulator, NtrC family, contains REC, AAA-type ATPase, and a Fis-type DNA-binding domains [Halomonas pantelleriensis]
MLLPKHVVVINDSPTRQSVLIESLSALGWSTECYRSLYSANDVLLRSKPGGIAIIIVEELVSTPLKDVENFICNKKMVWLGVISDEQHDNSHARHIVRLLNGVFRLPLTDNRLSNLLDYAYGQAMIKASISNIDRINVNGIMLRSCIPEVKHIFRLIHRVADSRAAVMILGESGTGKELVSRAIHDLSMRATGPFVALNCGSLANELIQSELFGHEKGAFTGATRQRIGHIEAASGGTLFLDEIGDLSTPLQVNLLRFLETHSIQRLSSSQEISVDVRIVSATHVDLEQAVEQGRFRLDLLHRLNTVIIHLPPLRQRKADIELIANQIFEDLSSRYPCKARGFHRDTIALMKSYHWPGNIREMLNRIKSAMLLCDGKLILPDKLNIEHIPRANSGNSLNEIKSQAERRLLTSVLRKNENNIARSAKEMGVSRVTFYRLAKKHNIIHRGDDQKKTM